MKILCPNVKIIYDQIRERICNWRQINEGRRMDGVGVKNQIIKEWQS
jgi:hypothetical protein